MQQEPTDRQADLAIHEAGHAVAAVHLDMPMRYVTIRARTADAAGQVVMGSLNGRYYRDIMILLAAGALAEDIATGCCDRNTVTAAAEVDLEGLRACAREVRDAQRRGEPTGMDLPTGASVRAIAEAGWQQAHHLITSRYGAVLAVTDALLTSRRALTRRDCRTIVADAGRADPPAHAHLARPFWPSQFRPGYFTPARTRKQAVRA